MAQGRIRALAAIPGPSSRDAIVRDFCRQPEGIVSAFSDAILPGLKSLVPDDTWVEVKPFGELVRSILELTGEPALQLSPSAHFRCAVAAAAETLGDQSPFFAVRTFTGFHAALTDAIKELAMWGIDAEEIRRLETELPPHLARKLHDLSEVNRQASEWMRELGRESHAEHLLRSLDGTPEHDGSIERILVFVGSEVAPLRMKWLNWLAESGVDITLVFDRDVATGTLFEGARIAAALIDAEPIELGQGNRLQTNLFVREPADGPDLDDGVIQVCAPDILYEVETALRMAESYGSLERTAILCRDLDQYGPLIDASARRLEIPIVIVRREPLLANSFARLTLAALQFCGSADVRDLLPIIRSTYLGMNATDRQSLTGVVREAHRTRNASWSHLSAWAQQNESTVPWLVALLQWRTDVQALHVRFAEWCGHLRTFIGRLPWAESKPGAPTISTRDVYAQSALLRCLSAYASIDQVSSQQELGLHQFTRIAHSLWEDADVAVPRAENGVYVGSSSASLPAVDQLIVLGLLEGTFPRRRTEEAIFSDEERAAISALRPETPPLLNSFDRSAEERDEFYRVCSSARRRLVLSYPLAGDSTDNVPAFYLGEVSRILPEAPSLVLSRDEIAPSIAECRLAADQRLRLALDAPVQTTLAKDLVTEEARSAIRVGPEEPLTPEQLADAARCPFAYSVRHRLGIRSGRSVARWSALRSLPQKAMLAIQPNLDQARFALEQALSAQLDDLYAEIPTWELRLLEAGGKRLIDESLLRERETRLTFPHSDLRVNVPFSAPDFRAELPGNLRLMGSIPAVSRFGDYRILHLYQASLKDIEGIGKEDMEQEDAQVDQSLVATRLLIGLYLWSAYHTELCPAIEVDSGSEKRTMVLQQRPMGPTGFPANAPIDVVALTPVRGQQGEWKESQVRFTQATRALVKPVLQAVRTGTMRTIPHKSACEVCEFGELCRRSTVFADSVAEEADESK
jgi:hypothetical protein